MLRRCVLYHTILDPVYLTMRLGYPQRFVMQNARYVSIAADEHEGWQDEDEISGDTKRMYVSMICHYQYLYRIYQPLMKRTIAELIDPMVGMQLTHEEFVAMKSIVCYQGCE